MWKKFVPFALADNIYEIDPNFYKKFGIDTIICDLDNTLDAYYVLTPSLEATNLIKSLKDNGFRVIIISNNTNGRVEKYARDANCEFVSLARKPFRSKSRKFIKNNNIDIKKAICIGDQVFTDVLFANRMKMKCVLCNNLVEKDQFFTKINKFFDKYLRKRILKKKLAKNWRNM